MEHFWDFARLLVIVGAVLLGLVLILLALPGSRFRKVLSTVFFPITGLLGIYIIIPLDFIPDLIPVLGQVDDVLASILAVISAIGGLLFYINNRQSLPEGEEKSKTDRYLSDFFMPFSSVISSLVRRPSMKRFMFLMLVLLVLLFTGNISVYAQNEPIGGCPDRFVLHPAMPHDDHHGHLHVGTDTDANVDGWLCMKHVSVNGQIHVHIDNDIPLP